MSVPKQNLLMHYVDKPLAKPIRFESVLDAFSGSGVVSYMFKTKGKTVYSNDFMTFCSNVAKAIIENNTITLNQKDLAFLLEPGDGDGFVANTFQGLYFSDEENIFIDDLRARIDKLQSPYKRALAIASLSRACLKRRPRGVVLLILVIAMDDGRKDLQRVLRSIFWSLWRPINKAVFDNGKRNIATNKDTMGIKEACRFSI
jgi:DNA adenine methylase